MCPTHIITATTKQRKASTSAANVSDDAADGIERRGLGGRNVTVFNFMNNMRTTEAQTTQREEKMRAQETAKRKLEVQKKMTGKQSTMKSIF